MEIKIKMPDELKSYIVDDWEQICKHKATNNSFYSPHNLTEMHKSDSDRQDWYSFN